MRALKGTMAAGLLLAAGACVELAGLGGPGVLLPEQRNIGMTYIGQSIDLIVLAEDSLGVDIPDIELSFESRDPGVASVSETGVLTANDVGSTTVVISSPCCSTDSITVNVGRGRLEINPPAVNFSAAGQSSNITYSALDAAGAPIPALGTVTFQSLNSGVATVSSLGQVFAHAIGTTAIVASSLCCSSDTTPVNVEESPPPPAGLLVSAKWGTATGNTIQAVTDGGKAVNPRWCAWQDILSVVPGAPVGFTRTTNVLAIHRIPGCGHVEFENLYPLPTAQPQFWAARYYVMNGPGQTHSEQHPFCLWPVGAIEAVHMSIDAQAGGNWHLGSGWGAGNYNFSQGGTGGPRFHWFPMDGANRRTLAAGTWYRYEFIIHWLNATQYRVYPRLYDMAGNLLNDHTTWRHSDGAGTFAQYYAAGGHFTRGASSNGADHIRTLSFGMGQTGSSGGYYYVADFAAALVTSNTDFIGTSP